MPQDTEYRFKACGDQLYVEEKGTRCWTGSVEVASGKHRVRNSDGEIVAVVDKIGDAIPPPSCALQDTSAPWKHEKPTEYVREDPKVHVMAAINDCIVTVFGGTGFLGRRVVRHLRNHGFSVRIASRHPN